MTTKEMQQRYQELFGKPTKSRNSTWLKGAITRGENAQRASDENVIQERNKDEANALEKMKPRAMSEIETEAREENAKRDAEAAAKVAEGFTPAEAKKIVASKKRKPAKEDVALVANAPAMLDALPETTREKLVNRDDRLPPVGTILEREVKGTKHAVKILATGFEYAGKEYRSLSAIAREITGTIWNGMLFFGLTKRGKAA